MSQEPVKLIVYVRGGVVQDIHTLGVPCDVAVIDADVQGCDEGDLTAVKDCDDTEYLASVGIWELREPGAYADENFRRIEAASWREQDRRGETK